MWMKTEQGSKCYHGPSTQMLERLYISEPGQQVQDGLRVLHLPEEWMHVCTYGGYPMPNTHNWSIQAVRTLFSFGLWGAAEAGYNFHSDLAPSATSREGDSASESCPYRPRNDTSWSSYYPNTTSESRERPSL